MSADRIDKGRAENETPEMRRTREALVTASPPPQFFRLRAQLLDRGRSNERVAETENMQVNLKVYAGGGENGLHNHSDEDHFHLVLSGSACFYGPRGEEKTCGPYEGVLLPVGCFYRFHALGDEPLVLLRVAARTAVTDRAGVPERAGAPAEHRRMNIYGRPLPSEAKENGQAEPTLRPGCFWGAGE